MKANKAKKFWIITDPHLLHEKTIIYCNRPDDFNDRIYKGLSQIDEDDVLICLGDVSASKYEAEAHERFIMPLKCTKILVKGNHDKKSDTWYYNHGWDFVCLAFRNVFFGKNILFTHHPKQWDGSYDYNIHGHFHNITTKNWEPELVKKITDKHILLACEHTFYQPVSLNWLVSKACFYDKLIDKLFKSPKIHSENVVYEEFEKSFRSNEPKFYFSKDKILFEGHGEQAMRLPLTKEEYDEIKSNSLYWDDLSCTCFQNPPCSKCTEGPSDEDLERIRNYEKDLEDK